MVRHAGPPQMYACAVAACLHGLVPKVPGYDPRSELRTTLAVKPQQVVRAYWDHAGVSATTRGTGQAIELFVGGHVRGSITRAGGVPGVCAPQLAPRTP